MSTQEIGLFEAKTHLSKLMERVLAGESFFITKRGEKVAWLGGPKAKAPFKARLRQTFRTFYYRGF